MRFTRVFVVTLLAALLVAFTHNTWATGSDLTPPQLLAYKLVQMVIPEYIAARHRDAKQPVTVSQILLSREIYVPTDPRLGADLSAWNARAYPEIPSPIWEDSPWPIWLVHGHKSCYSKPFDSLFPGQIYLEIRIDGKGRVVAEVWWTFVNSVEITLTVESGEPVIKETLLVTQTSCN